MKNEMYGRFLKLERLCVSVINNFSGNNYEKGNMLFTGILTEIQELLVTMNGNEVETEKAGIQLDVNSLCKVLQNLLKMQESKDYFGMQGELAGGLMPMLEQNMQKLNDSEDFSFYPYFEQNMHFLQEHNKELFLELSKNRDKNIKGQIRYAKDGNPTLKLCDGAGEYYLHGIENPFADEIDAMRNYVNQETTKYHVLGLGLGYHVIQLALLSDFTDIDVYEGDIKVIWQMIRYQSIWSLEAFSKNRVRIHFDPYYTQFAEAMKRPGETTVIHYPSLRNIANEKVRREFLNFFIRDNSYRQMYPKMYHNFCYNQKHIDTSVDELKKDFTGKDVYIIAAGPSLDKNLNLLVVHPENAIVIATGTVLKKCRKRNIPIDYGIFLDAKDTMKRQIEGIEEWTLPLMIASSTSRFIAEIEKGKKYIVCQNGFTPAEKYAEKMGYHLYESGGSVSTLAFDIALYLQAGRIICLGLDLAYQGELAHAVDTSHQLIPEEAELFLHRGFWREHEVQIDHKFDLYRKWFERRIKEARQQNCHTEFINATEGGVYIEGMKHRELKDVNRR